MKKIPTWLASILGLIALLLMIITCPVWFPLWIGLGLWIEIERMAKRRRSRKSMSAPLVATTPELTPPEK